jgi:tRNA-modifying protein YgfZ
VQQLNKERMLSSDTTGKTPEEKFPLGLAMVSGRDALDFIHRVSTNDVNNLTEGQGITTIFTTDKGKIIDVVDLYRFNEVVYLLYSNGAYDAINQLFQKYVIMDEVELIKEGQRTLRIIKDKEKPEKTVQEIPNGALRFGAPRIFPAGYVLASDDNLEIALSSDIHPINIKDFKSYRIEHGITLYGVEFSDEFNPFECDLLGFISLTKGCYIGQEVIARLDTYGKVKKFLRGLVIDDSMIEADISGIAHKTSRCTLIVDDNEIAHTITSIVFSPTLKKTICLVRLEKKNPEHNTPALLYVENRKYRVTLVDLPLIQE